jgi:hypothetical protein
MDDSEIIEAFLWLLYEIRDCSCSLFVVFTTHKHTKENNTPKTVRNLSKAPILKHPFVATRNPSQSQ